MHPYLYTLTIRTMFRASLLTGFALALVATLIAAKRHTRRILAPVRAGKRNVRNA